MYRRGKRCSGRQILSLQVPVKKIPYETGANTPGSSPQAGKDTGADTDNILQEALKDETAGNENDFNKIAKNENEEDGDAQNENTHLPDMKIKVESRKTKPVLESVQFESFPRKQGLKGFEI